MAYPLGWYGLTDLGAQAEQALDDQSGGAPLKQNAMAAVSDSQGDGLARVVIVPCAQLVVAERSHLSCAIGEEVGAGALL